MSEIEEAADAVWESLDAQHDDAYHVHASECCWSFRGSMDAITEALTPILDERDALRAQVERVRGALNPRVEVALPLGRALAEVDREAGEYARVNPDALLAIMDEVTAIRAALDGPQ